MAIVAGANVTEPAWVGSCLLQAALWVGGLCAVDRQSPQALWFQKGQKQCHFWAFTFAVGSHQKSKMWLPSSLEHRYPCVHVPQLQALLLATCGLRQLLSSLP